jgi:N-methylhydantoinase A
MEGRLREHLGELADGAEVRRTFDGRLLGQSWETPLVAMPKGPISAETIPGLVDRFHTEYAQRFGQRFDHLPVQGVTYRVEIVVPVDKVSYETTASAAAGTTPEAEGTFELRHFDQQPLEAAVYRRERLLPGERIEGPAVIREPLCTTFVCPGQVGTIGRFGEISIEIEGGAER